MPYFQNGLLQGNLATVNFQHSELLRQQSIISHQTKAPLVLHNGLLHHGAFTVVANLCFCYSSIIHHSYFAFRVLIIIIYKDTYSSPKLIIQAPPTKSLHLISCYFIFPIVCYYLVSCYFPTTSYLFTPVILHSIFIASFCYFITYFVSCYFTFRSFMSFYFTHPPPPVDITHSTSIVIPLTQTPSSFSLPNHLIEIFPSLTSSNQYALRFRS